MEKRINHNILNSCSNRQRQDLIRVTAMVSNSCMFQHFLHCKLYASGYIYSRFMLESSDNAPCSWVFRSRDIDNHAIRIGPFKTLQNISL